MATTPKRVIELLKEEIPAKISLNQFCKKTGINPNSVDKYMAGVTEPTQASLQKLADYFEKPVAWLRGGDDIIPDEWKEGLIEIAQKLRASYPDEQDFHEAVRRMKISMETLPNGGGLIRINPIVKKQKKKNDD